MRTWGISCWRRFGGVRGLMPRTEVVLLGLVFSGESQWGLTPPVLHAFLVTNIPVDAVVLGPGQLNAIDRARERLTAILCLTLWKMEADNV